MKKLYVLLAAFLLAGAVSAQTWTFSTPETFSSTSVKDGLTINATAAATVVVDANSKPFEGVDYTHRLKLGGNGVFTDGSPTARVLSFPVTGNSTISIVCMSSSSTEDRTLNFHATNNAISDVSVPALKSISKTDVAYTGDATTIYVYSPKSGVNIYSISVTGLKSGINDEIGSSDVTSVEYFSISGAKVSNEFESLAPGIYIQKSTYDNGTVKSVKINKEK